MAFASWTAQIHEKKIVTREREKGEEGRALSAWAWNKK
jgi:hypothetical protein